MHCSLESGRVPTDKLADLLDCLLPFRQDRSEELPDMDHVGPHLQVYLHPSRFCPLSYPGGVIEQGLGGTDLDKQRRQPAQIGMKRRGKGRLGICPPKIEL